MTSHAPTIGYRWCTVGRGFTPAGREMYPFVEIAGEKERIATTSLRTGLAMTAEIKHSTVSLELLTNTQHFTAGPM